MSLHFLCSLASLRSERQENANTPAPAGPSAEPDGKRSQRVFAAETMTRESLCFPPCVFASHLSPWRRCGRARGQNTLHHAHTRGERRGELGGRRSPAPTVVLCLAHTSAAPHLRWRPLPPLIPDRSSESAGLTSLNAATAAAATASLSKNRGVRGEASEGGC